MSTKKIYIMFFMSMILLFGVFANAQVAQKPKYSADVPEFLLTPDKVETEFMGDLEFFDGMPSESTAKKAYDFLDLSRGVEAFLNGMPATSIYAFLEGLKGSKPIPGKSYLVILRLYGPLEAWFDKSWKPGDFELVE